MPFPRLSLFVVAGMTALTAQSPRTVDVVRPPALPRAITSFGAATSGGHLYVFGGHIGRAHAHTRDNVVGSFWRLDLVSAGSWEQLPDGPPLQGTALAAAPDGRLFRVGGLAARNAPGQPADLHSTASVQVFDPATGSWSDFAPLPEPRSSHDAIVVGDRLFVAGGWTLAGEGDGEWLKTCWACDLTAAEPIWQPIPDLPYERRAMALARFGSRIALVGGMDDFGMSSEAGCYDPATETWTDLAELPGPAFGAAALGVGDALFATTMDGRVLRFDDGADDWATVTTLTVPRFFHRLALAADGAHLLAIGGAGRGGHMRHVELVPIAEGAVHPMHEWTLAFPGSQRQRPAVTIADERIRLLGGNRGARRDRFAPANLTAEAATIDMASLTARVDARLPTARQSAEVVAWGDRASLVLGGLGLPAGEADAVRSLADAALVRRGGVQHVPAAMPSPRTQFAALNWGGKVWIFGGTDFRPAPDGGEASQPLEVLIGDPTAETPRFEPAGIALPSPRRSFGAVLVGDEAWLIGGLGDGFEAADGCDVFHFPTRTWRKLPAPPRPWVSPQVAAIGGVVYVACGGTMKGQRFTEDRSIVSYDAERGWRRVLDELPFGVRHVTMRAVRDRLWFVDLGEPGRAIVRTWRPTDAIPVFAAPIHGGG